MWPRLTSNNHTNQRVGHSELFGQGCFVSFSEEAPFNFLHLVGRKLGVGNLFPASRIAPAFEAFVPIVQCVVSQKKVAGIYASGVVATMKNQFSIRNVSPVNEPRISVGENKFVSDSHRPVSKRLLRTVPGPALIRSKNRHLCPKPIQCERSTIGHCFGGFARKVCHNRQYNTEPLVMERGMQ